MIAEKEKLPESNPHDNTLEEILYVINCEEFDISINGITRVILSIKTISHIEKNTIFVKKISFSQIFLSLYKKLSNNQISHETDLSILNFKLLPSNEKAKKIILINNNCGKDEFINLGKSLEFKLNKNNSHETKRKGM